MKSEKEEIIIEEFKTSRVKNVTQRSAYAKSVYSNYVIPVSFCLVFLLAVLAGMFWLNLPVVFVCVVLVLEAMIGICLHNVPVWVHGMEVIISILAGIIFDKTAFMVIGAFIYIASILVLHMLNQKG